MKLRNYRKHAQNGLSYAFLAGAIGIGLASCFLFYLSRYTAVPAAWGSNGGSRHDFASWFNTLQLGLVVPLLTGLFGNLIRRQQVVPRIGQLFTMICLLSALMNFIQEYVVYSAFTRTDPLPGTSAFAWINNFAWVFLLLTSLYLLAIFPNGRFHSQRWRVVILTILFFFAVPLVIGSAIETPLSSAFQLPNPFISQQPAQTYNALFNVGIAAMIAAVVAILGAVLLRFRRGWGRERQQMKWLLAGVVLMVISVVVGLGLSFDLELPIGNLIVNSAFLWPCVGVGVALVRHQLFDIDIIIRRTLLYTAVSAFLALIYFGCVVLLQAAFNSMVADQSPVVIVISTLVSTALFAPVRRQIQALIDRRFYRQKYDAQQILAAFAQTARDEVSLEALTAELTHIVQETMQPEKVVFWMADPSRLSIEQN